MADPIRAQIADGIDSVEGAYEFFLAYAAQGITNESESARVGAQLRKHLDQMATALSELAPLLGSLIEQGGTEVAGQVQDFKALLEADAAKAGAIVSLVRGQESITSQLVDNLNASVHVRTLLTDLFVLDEVLKLGVDRKTTPEPSGTAT